VGLQGKSKFALRRWNIFYVPIYRLQLVQAQEGVGEELEGAEEPQGEEAETGEEIEEDAEELQSDDSVSSDDDEVNELQDEHGLVPKNENKGKRFLKLAENEKIELNETTLQASSKLNSAPAEVEKKDSGKDGEGEEEEAEAVNPFDPAHIRNRVKKSMSKKNKGNSKRNSTKPKTKKEIKDSVKAQIKD
jgi:hypothetical protein